MADATKSIPAWTLWTIFDTKEGYGVHPQPEDVLRRRKLWEYLQEVIPSVPGDVTKESGVPAKLYVVTLKRKIQTYPFLRFETNLTDFTCMTFSSSKKTWYLDVPADLGNFLKPVLVPDEQFVILGGGLDVDTKTLRLRRSLHRDDNFEDVTIFHFVINANGKPESTQRPYGQPIDRIRYTSFCYDANPACLKVIPRISNSTQENGKSDSSNSESSVTHSVQQRASTPPIPNGRSATTSSSSGSYKTASPNLSQTWLHDDAGDELLGSVSSQYAIFGSTIRSLPTPTGSTSGDSVHGKPVRYFEIIDLSDSD